jgi:serine/threonine protein kinase
MLTGLPPFYSQDREELFNNIKFGSLKFPSSLTPACKSLLEGLFHKNPEKRLGSKGGKESN